MTNEIVHDPGTSKEILCGFLIRFFVFAFIAKANDPRTQSLQHGEVSWMYQLAKKKKPPQPSFPEGRRQSKLQTFLAVSLLDVSTIWLCLFFFCVCVCVYVARKISSGSWSSSWSSSSVVSTRVHTHTICAMLWLLLVQSWSSASAWEYAYAVHTGM